MITKLFRKWFRKEDASSCESSRVVTTDYFKVISADEIADMEAPPFNQAQWKDESDYREYLTCVQSLIEEYERDGAIHKLVYNSFDDIEKNRDEKIVLDNFHHSFLDSGQWIGVEKSLDGSYRVASNGRHRMYVAKKYGLKLLVHVSQEVRANEKNTLK